MYAKTKWLKADGALHVLGKYMVRHNTPSKNKWEIVYAQFLDTYYVVESLTGTPITPFAFLYFQENSLIGWVPSLFVKQILEQKGLDPYEWVVKYGNCGEPLATRKKPRGVK